MNRGDEVLLRHVFRGHVASAMPMTVIEDTDERVVLWQQVGAPAMGMATTPLPAWVEGGYGNVPWTWRDTNTIQLIPKDRAHSIYVMREAETGNPICWYVNLQEVLRPTRFGWDTSDQELDIVAWPDLSEWWWKDEAELEERVALGFLTRAEADEVRREGERVVADIEARRRPFDEPWWDWRPEPWPIPALPDDWDVV